MLLISGGRFTVVDELFDHRDKHRRIGSLQSAATYLSNRKDGRRDLGGGSVRDTGPFVKIRFGDGLINTADTRGVLAVASTRRLCENARQSQAASWRAASMIEPRGVVGFRGILDA